MEYHRPKYFSFFVFVEIKNPLCGVAQDFYDGSNLIERKPVWGKTVRTIAKLPERGPPSIQPRNQSQSQFFFLQKTVRSANCAPVNLPDQKEAPSAPETRKRPQIRDQKEATRGETPERGSNSLLQIGPGFRYQGKYLAADLATRIFWEYFLNVGPLGTWHLIISFPYIHWTKIVSAWKWILRVPCNFKVYWCQE